MMKNSFDDKFLRKKKSRVITFGFREISTTANKPALDLGNTSKALSETDEIGQVRLIR